VLRVLTPRPVRPTAREAAMNPRAASARLRVAEKVG
jgi:16S rRNA C1402 N4-methylase RsmH